jgi:hypothetical protein
VRIKWTPSRSSRKGDQLPANGGRWAAPEYLWVQSFRGCHQAGGAFGHLQRRCGGISALLLSRFDMVNAAPDSLTGAVLNGSELTTVGDALACLHSRDLALLGSMRASCTRVLNCKIQYQRQRRDPSCAVSHYPKKQWTLHNAAQSCKRLADQ